jgi:hypothetical protein
VQAPDNFPDTKQPCNKCTLLLSRFQGNSHKDIGCFFPHLLLFVNEGQILTNWGNLKANSCLTCINCGDKLTSYLLLKGNGPWLNFFQGVMSNISRDLVIQVWERLAKLWEQLTWDDQTNILIHHCWGRKRNLVKSSDNWRESLTCFNKELQLICKIIASCF